jgi:tetratricopeptide (TPR) repeat protein
MFPRSWSARYRRSPGSWRNRITLAARRSPRHARRCPPGWKGAALQFAEAGARALPDDPLRCYAAGRLCRRAGEFERAKRWLARAIRLARRANDDIAFAHAHRGYGFVLADMGRFARAEPHFWKSVRAARRTGRRSLEGSGYHDLFMVAVHLERWTDALEYAQRAVALYKRGHPRFPLLAHDIAFFWCRRGFFSSGLPVFEKVLPLVERQRERILVLASLARSAAVVRDNIRFQRAASAVLALAAIDSEMSASSLYHVAAGARCFYEWERAEDLARRALASAQRRGNATVVELAEQLLDGLRARQPGETDAVPAEGSIVDATRELLLRKLARHPAIDYASFPPNPERYPTE